MTKLKKTRKAYEEYLDEVQPAPESDEWIIGGKERTALMWARRYGQALRKYDPIGFTVGFNEWIL